MVTIRAFARELALFFCICTVLPGSLRASQQVEESNQDTVATIGPSIITVKELDDRIGLMPWIGTKRLSQIDSVKREALNSLIAEKLLALRGTELRLTADLSTQAMGRSLERLLARDELYKREVIHKIRLSSSEIASGMSRYARQLRVRVVVASTQSNALIVKRIIEERMRRDTLASEPFGSLVTSEDTVEIRFGKTNQNIEDRAYALRQGEVSLPIAMDSYGWVVLELLDEQTNTDYANKSMPERRLTVEKLLKDRKRDVRAIEYFSATLSPKSASVDPEALKLLADSLRAIIVQDSSARFVSGHYHSKPADVDQLRECLGDHLDTVLVRFDKRDLTIGEALEGLRYQAFLFRSLRRNNFLLEVSQMLKKIVEGELLAQEALRRHLQNTPDVRNTLSLWADYWSANRLASSIVDTIRVGADETAALMLENHPDLMKSDFVNIQEIFSDTLRKILKLAIRTNHGELLEELAGANTERNAWKAHDGISGFFAIAEHPAIGLAALLADSNATVGPLQTERGYSLFKVLGKKLSIETIRMLDSLVNDSHVKVLVKKQTEALEKFVAELKIKYSVAIRYENLGKLSIRPFPMVTKRLIGFGGAIPAVPPLGLLSGWTKRQSDANQLFQ